MSELTNLEWNILESLSNDEETVALILSLIKKDFPEITTREVAQNIYSLYERGLIYEDNGKEVYLRTLLDESEDYMENVYWFGLTEAGCKYWEDFALEYGGESIDWSNAWKGHISIKSREGYIDGTSLETCLQGLDKIDDDIEWQIDRSTLVHSDIKGFQAKYYKYLQGGHNISFKLKKRKS
jgi:hypothetical protein